jgi:hypothetical protein
MAKRNTAATAVTQYELEQISGAAYNGTAKPYSDCFATENTLAPERHGYGGSCASSYTMRVDVSWDPGPNNTQLWSITVNSWPAPVQIGGMVQTLKMNRRDQT